MAVTIARRRRWVPSRARPAPLRAARRAEADYGSTAQPDWRTVDFQAARRSVVVGGRPVNVVSLGAGQGPPVVCLHGLGGSWKNWLETMPFVAGHRRTVAVDLPGFGESELPEAGITIPAYAECVDELCERLELGAVDVVGNSMGGFVAAELAITRRARVHALVLVDAAASRSPICVAGRLALSCASWPHRRGGGWVSGRCFCVPACAILPSGRSSAIPPAWLSTSSLSRPAAPVWVCQGSCSPWTPCSAMTSATGSARSGVPRSSFKAEDMLVPVADAWEFRRLIPGSRAVVMHDTGHVPMLERPRTFNTLLADFFGLDNPS